MRIALRVCTSVLSLGFVSGSQFNICLSINGTSTCKLLFGIYGRYAHYTKYKYMYIVSIRQLFCVTSDLGEETV